MKRILSILLLLALLLCGCGAKGDVSDVQLDIGPSQLYGAGEIKAAAGTVIDAFRDMMEGCTLRELSYDEELNLKQREEWAQQFHADEAIVLKSVFDVGLENGPLTLEPGSTHKWTWVLTRNGRGGWTLRNWGYA